MLRYPYLLSEWDTLSNTIVTVFIFDKCSREMFFTMYRGEILM